MLYHSQPPRWTLQPLCLTILVTLARAQNKSRWFVDITIDRPGCEYLSICICLISNHTEKTKIELNAKLIVAIVRVGSKINWTRNTFRIVVHNIRKNNSSPFIATNSVQYQQLEQRLAPRTRLTNTCFARIPL